RDQPHCQQEFKNKGVDIAKFVSYAESKKHLDFTANENGFYAGRAFKDLPLPNNDPGLTGPHSTEKVHNLLNTHVGNPIFAITFRAQGTITIGHNFYNLLDVTLQNETIAHEVFHLYFNADSHIDIAVKLNLPFDKKGD